MERLIRALMEKLESVAELLEEVLSSGTDVGVPATYTMDAEGNVTPTAGEGEEEEEGEEKEEEGKGGGGEEFPPLPKNLAEMMDIDSGNLFTNDPDLSLEEWEWFTYVPPSGTTYLVVPYWQMDRVGNGTPGTLDATLGGAAPDTNWNSVWTGTGTGGNRKRRGIFVWKEPSEGLLKLFLSGGEKGQCNIVCFPISVFGGINVAEVGNTVNGGYTSAGIVSASINFTLPRVYVLAQGISTDLTPPLPSQIWTGYKIFGADIVAPVGLGRANHIECIVGVHATGTWNWIGAYPPQSDLYANASSYGSMGLVGLNL
jgi:hypothetical protein